eukprot:9501416-Pyramimonas_sp.AAC.1
MKTGVTSASPASPRSSLRTGRPPAVTPLGEVTAVVSSTVAEQVQDFCAQLAAHPASAAKLAEKHSQDVLRRILPVSL